MGKDTIRKFLTKTTQIKLSEPYLCDQIKFGTFGSRQIQSDTLYDTDFMVAVRSLSGIIY